MSSWTARLSWIVCTKTIWTTSEATLIKSRNLSKRSWTHAKKHGKSRFRSPKRLQQTGDGCPPLSNPERTGLQSKLRCLPPQKPGSTRTIGMPDGSCSAGRGQSILGFAEADLGVQRGVTADASVIYCGRHGRDGRCSQARSAGWILASSDLSFSCFEILAAALWLCALVTRAPVRSHAVSCNLAECLAWQKRIPWAWPELRIR